MANKKISDFTELTTPADGDLMEIVDVSDTSEAPTGTNKKIAFSNITIADASTTVKGKVELATDAETITGTDTARAITPSNYRNAFDDTLPAIVHAATEKTTPVDADEFGLVDSSASYVLKKLTWANIKATLLTWLRLSTTIIPTNAPQGFLINGKISVTVASNNLTVSLKTLAGADPSATDPVYCRIGDTVRSVTSALSVSANAGTNWCNAGSSELATKEIDYFVYLVWNTANSAVNIAFSRIPSGTQFSDFSTTDTNEKRLQMDTYAGLVSSDYVENIGRFAATLSSGAGYTWSVPTFTAKNLIQRPIYETRTLQQVLGLGYVTEGNATGTMEYKITGDEVHATGTFVWGSTTSASGSIQFTLPFASGYSSTKRPVGSFYALDSGTRHYIGTLVQLSSTTFFDAFVDDSGGSQISNTSPVTWANTDIWAWDATYKI